MKRYNERAKQKSHMVKDQHVAQTAVDAMGKGHKDKPKDLEFGPQTLIECAKDSDRRKRYKEALRDHIDSWRGYKRQCNVHLMLDHFTDNEGCFEVTKDLDKSCWSYSQDALKGEMEVFAKQLATAVAKYQSKLEKASHGEVRPLARGGKPGHDSQETVLEDDGLRRLEILNRICLAPMAQLKKDLKIKIEESNQDVKKIGNPITHLLTVNKHDLKMYSELEQQVV